MSKCGDGISFQLFLAHSLGPLHSGLNGIRNLSFPSHHFPGLSGLIVSLQKAKVSSGYLICMYQMNVYTYIHIFFMEKSNFSTHTPWSWSFGSHSCIAVPVALSLYHG